MPLQGLDFTFHRAFDMVRSQRQALDALISCGVPRVLTSGGAHTALQVTPTCCLMPQPVLPGTPSRVTHYNRPLLTLLKSHHPPYVSASISTQR